MNLRKYKELVYSIIGAAMEVHRELGGGGCWNPYTTKRFLLNFRKEALIVSVKSNFHVTTKNTNWQNIIRWTW